MKEFSVDEFVTLLKNNTAVVDIRSIDLIKQGYIKDSIAFSSTELFSSYGGAFLSSVDGNKGLANILLLCDASDNENFVKNAQRLGIKVLGALKGGFDAWAEAGGAIDMIIDVEADELMMDIPFDDNLVIMDIRSAIDFGNGHLKDAINIALADLIDPLRISAIEETDNLYIIGDNDAESFLAATILKKQDIHNLRVVSGGWHAVQKQKKASIVKDPGLLN